MFFLFGGANFNVRTFREKEMTTKLIVTKIAKFTLTRFPSQGTHEPNETATIILAERGGKVLAQRVGLDKFAMKLGKFYHDTPEGMFLVRYIRGMVKLEELDGAVVNYQVLRGTAHGMSGRSIWTKVLFKDGKIKEFRDSI